MLFDKAKKFFKALQKAFELVEKEESAKTVREQPAPAVSPKAPAQEKRISFNFEGRKPEWLDEMNGQLSGLRFSELKIEDFHGYLCTARQTDAAGNEVSVSYRYGLDDCVLAGTEAADGFVYRMDTEVTGDDVDSNTFNSRWRAQNPGRVIRVLTCVGFEGKHAFVFLHHARAGQPEAEKKQDAKPQQTAQTLPQSARPAPAPEKTAPAAPKQSELKFTFPDHGPEWQDELNAALSMKRFLEMKIDDLQWYVAETQGTDADGKETIVSSRFGLNSCALSGTEAENGYIFRADSGLTDRVMTDDALMEQWRAQHPDRVPHIMRYMKLEGKNAYFILYRVR